MSRQALAIAGGGALTVAGCNSRLAALDPAGVQAGRIGDLWWLTLYVAIAVYLLSMAAILLAVVVKRARAGDPALAAIAAGGERLRVGIVGAAVLATIIILFWLLVNDYATGQATRSLAESAT